jgi:glycosyltransferase involved in cell wall biosynthesis
MIVETPGAGVLDQSLAVPQISVLMTVYNTAGFLRDAIESVFAQQTERTTELLIVDDGSTDSSFSIAQRYAVDYPQYVRVFQHPEGRNLGISRSRNLALRHARGAHLAFLDSDDVWLPHHCETLSSALDTTPGVAMVYGAAERWVDHRLPFDEAKARAASWGYNYLPPLFPKGECGGILRRGVLVRWYTADESFCPCICSVMVRTDAARAVGGFCDDFRGLYDDQAFHAKISLSYQVRALDTCVARYRQHDQSCCALAKTNVSTKEKERKRFSDFLDQQRSALV